MAGDLEADLVDDPREEPAPSAPPTLRALARSWRWAPWLVGVLVALRLLAVAGMRLYLYFDSGEYDRIDFSGNWRRPWATPYLYWLIPGTNRSIVIAQALIGAVCWAVLALAAAAWFRTAIGRLAVAAAIGGIGCTTIITNWDAAKLSESLGISLTVLLIAAWLNFVRKPDRATAVLVALATFPWLFVRQSLISAAWLIVLVVGIAALVAWQRGHGAKVLAGLCLALALETGVASVTYTHNQEIVQENLRVIVSNRVATDPGRLAWFKAHGMPVPSSGAMDPQSLQNDTAFSHWAAHEGRGTYLRYLVTHPWYTATAPLPDFAGVRRPSVDAAAAAPQNSMLAPTDVYATSRPVLPTVVELALFGPGDTGAVIAGLVVVLAWSLARRDRRGQSWIVPLVLIVISFASLYTGWHGATPELPRLGLLGAIGIRIALVVQLALLIEGEVVAWRPSLAGPVGDPAVTS
ncbi:hypothetical protein [Aquihabitans sp. McL0605]|uniref:hypothetical protein n=1 Tax=Aquihabitans sp. McL0605 TaxID=3415671 RepID=UPI003CFAE600